MCHRDFKVTSFSSSVRKLLYNQYSVLNKDLAPHFQGQRKAVLLKGQTLKGLISNDYPTIASRFSTNKTRHFQKVPISKETMDQAASNKTISNAFTTHGSECMQLFC